MREDVQCGKITDVIQPNPVNHRTTLLYIGDERAELENQREHKYSYPSVCTQCTICLQATRSKKPTSKDPNTTHSYF